MSCMQPDRLHHDVLRSQNPLRDRHMQWLLSALRWRNLRVVTRGRIRFDDMLEIRPRRTLVMIRLGYEH